MYGDIVNTDLCRKFYHLGPTRLLSTFDTDLWKTAQSEKLQISKITSEEITKHFHNTCLYLAQLITAPLYRTHSNISIDSIDHCTVTGQFSDGYSTAMCMAMLFSNYPHVIFFICNFSICVIFTNLCQTWTIYGQYRKMRSVWIMLPYNYQIWKYDPSYKYGLSFLRLVYHNITLYNYKESVQFLFLYFYQTRHEVWAISGCHSAGIFKMPLWHRIQ